MRYIITIICLLTAISATAQTRIKRLKRDSLRMQPIERHSLRSTDRVPKRQMPGNNRRNWTEYEAGRLFNLWDVSARLNQKWLGKPSVYDIDRLRAWADFEAEQLDYVPLQFDLSGIRAIGEVRAPRTANEAVNQEAEIAHFATLGYNALFAVWYPGNDAYVLAQIMTRYKNDGWAILFAVGQHEEAHKLNVYMPLSELQQALELTLPHADAFLPAWRGTSAPHTFNAAARTRYHAKIATLARHISPSMPIITEQYLTRGKLNGEKIKNASALLVLGAGWRGVRPDYVVSLSEEPTLALVIGPQPYYASFRKIQHWQQQEVRATCSRIEERYHIAGAGTITLCGDGADGRAPGKQANTTSDTLTESERTEQ